MTRLQLGRTLVRLTGFDVQPGREIVVELSVEGVSLRGKGERRRLFISWMDAWKEGVALGEERKRAEKKRRRAEKKAARRAA